MDTNASTSASSLHKRQFTYEEGQNMRYYENIKSVRGYVYITNTVLYIIYRNTCLQSTK